MKLKFNRDTKLWIPNIGVFNAGEIIETKDNKIVKKMLKSGYFNEIKENKIIKKGDEK